MRLLTVCACLGFALFSNLLQGEAYGRGHHRRAKNNCCQQPVTNCVNYGQSGQNYDKGNLRGDGFTLSGGEVGNGVTVHTQETHGLALSGQETHGLVNAGQVGNTVQNGRVVVGHGVNNGMLNGHEIGDHRHPSAMTGNGLALDGSISTDGRVLRIESSTLGGNSGLVSGSFAGNGFVSNACGCGN